MGKCSASPQVSNSTSPIETSMNPNVAPGAGKGEKYFQGAMPMGRFQNFEDFLSLFPAKPRDKIRAGFNVICPAHADRKPSLSVTRNNNKILLDCKAGCGAESVVEALGLTMSDLFLDHSPSPSKKIVATYSYHNAEGKLVYEVVRFEPKGFSQRRPGGKGGYTWNLIGIKPVLYHLPDILKAIRHNDRIYIVEGERDAGRLWGLGLVATTNPMGAGKWKEHYSDTLKGGNIVILPDNNQPGVDHALSIANSSYGKAKSIKLLEPFKDSIDVSDWLDNGHSIEELEALVENTPDYSPPNVNKDTIYSNAPEKQNLASKRDNFGTTSGQDWGIYAKRFDDLMRESGGGIDKREVAETIGLKATSDTFRKLLNRRKSEGKVRPYRGSPYLIEWVNKDYTVTRLDKMKAHPMLDIYLPLKIHEYAGVPPGSVIGIAGMTSSGKTSFLLEMAELNVLTQPLAVYYWYNEMSEAKMIYRCEDFPLLLQAQKAEKFFPVKQGNFEFADVLQPDAINLIDYIDRDDDVFLIGADIKKLYSKLNNGVVIFALQKKANLDLGYGGNMSIKLSNLYITLDTKYQSGKSMHGIAKIVKCKDWKSIEVNPSGLYCEYHTGGKHGKLFLDEDWKQSNK